MALKVFYFYFRNHNLLKTTLPCLVSPHRALPNHAPLRPAKPRPAKPRPAMPCFYLIIILFSHNFQYFFFNIV
jgi:hypothetical protein